MEDLAQVGLRRNPRRAHLLVSRVLGKHLPTPPLAVLSAQRLLGVLCAHHLAGTDLSSDQMVLAGARLKAGLTGDRDALVELDAWISEAIDATGPLSPRPVVLGFAETATALGFGVAEALGAEYLHSTRNPAPVGVGEIGFREEHSHAADHRLVPEDPRLVQGTQPLVLVDDEISTARTARNVIEVLHARSPRPYYLVASYLDLRSDQDRDDLVRWARELGIRVDVVALASGRVHLPEDVLTRAADLVAVHDRSAVQHEAPRAGERRKLTVAWPAGVPLTAENGVDHREQRALEAEAARVGRELAVHLREGIVGMSGSASVRSLHVLGTEEFIQVPLVVAATLAEELRGHRVTFSTTTRSPVALIEAPDYPVRTSVAFTRSGDQADTPHRYAHNVPTPRDDTPGDDSTTDDRTPYVVWVQDAQMGRDDFSAQLTRQGVDHLVVRLDTHRPSPLAHPARPEPLRGPAFGSYAADEVSWLLTDLSEVALEASTEEREETIQSGRGHYAESLPVEYQPSPRYQQEFEAALTANEQRVAELVGTLAERIRHRRGDDLVLVSLARAGTPVGILLRRWYAHRHGLEVSHHTVSIVRGRGIDQQALAHLHRNHGDRRVQFVDGWTGKGAITHELRAAVRDFNAAASTRFDPELAVLADPGWTTPLYGTREDTLIPSACLNSTVSGLVSRTVLNEDLLGPGEFHGAKFYAELAPADVSTVFLDRVARHFGAVRPMVLAADLTPADARPDWRGWELVERLAREHETEVNLVKPGVGETTRVLLRRTPWVVFVDPDREHEVGHVLTLAAERGVPVQRVPDLAYACIGLVRPLAAEAR